MALCSLFALFAGYIFQVNALTSNAYALTRAETEVKKLLQEQKDLETSRAKTFSFSSMTSLAEKLQFERVGEIRYIQVISGSVAQRSSSSQ